MSRSVITVEGLGKSYRIGGRQASYKRFTESVMEAVKTPVRMLRFGRRPARPTIWALKDISFEIQKGDVVGVIGANGAGKSTLLKILSRITVPTTGRARVRGRVGSLLEVGTGFHPELTGRENVYLNGAIMGMKKREIDRKFDEIVAFSGIETFIDTPVKRFSSGMYVRLAFAVAAHLEPEILLVDEVLAVGDAAFQKKCLGRMGEVAREGRTILLVSHNMGSIRQLCRRSLWIEEGHVRLDGETGDVADAYIQQAYGNGAHSSSSYPEDPTLEAQVRFARTVNREGETTPHFSCDEPVIVEIDYQIHRPANGMYGCFQVTRSDGTVTMLSYSYEAHPDPLDCGLPAGRYLVNVTIPPRTLGHGNYTVQYSLGLGRMGTRVVQDCRSLVTFTLDDFTSSVGNRRIGFFSTLLEWTARPLLTAPTTTEAP